jgi:hypothetical protein
MIAHTLAFKRGGGGRTISVASRHVNKFRTEIEKMKVGIRLSGQEVEVK